MSLLWNCGKKLWHLVSTIKHALFMIISCMKTVSALLALCAVNSPVDSPHKRPVIQTFDDFFVISVNKFSTNSPSSGDLRHLNAHVTPLWCNFSDDSCPEKSKKDIGFLPAYKWSGVYRALKPFLRPFGDSGEGRLDFYHRSLSKAVRKKWVGNSMLKFSFM